MGINVRIRDGMCPDPTTGEGGATEGDIRGSFSDIIDVVGVKDLAGGHCAVTENSPAAMSVLVAPGVVYIPNANYDELDSNTVKFWEAIVTVSTAVTITANTSGSTRIDLICAKMDTAVTPDEHASNIATLVAVAGTPGAGAPATPDNHYVLATVAVANGASTIVTGNITDKRVQSKIDFHYLPTLVFTNSLAYQCIINGGFTVNQRGYVSNATLAAGVYGHDRWKAGAGGGDYTFTQLAQATQITIKTGKSLIQVIEDKNVIGGTYTLSWTGTAQARFGINSATPSGAYAASPITITTQTAGTVMSVEFNEGTLGKINLANSSVALPFMPNKKSQEEIDSKRFYEKSYNESVVPGTDSELGCVSFVTPSTTLQISIPYTVRKRTSVTPTIYSKTGASGKLRDVTAGSDVSYSGIVSGENGFIVYGESTANHVYEFHWTAEAEL